MLRKRLIIRSLIDQGIWSITHGSFKGYLYAAHFEDDDLLARELEKATKICACELVTVYLEQEKVIEKKPSIAPTQLQPNAIKLTHVGLYRDGGSRDLVDANGVEYFQDRSFSSRMKHNDSPFTSTFNRVYKSDNINRHPWPEPMDPSTFFIKEPDGSISTY